MAINILENNDMLLFLIETGTKIQGQIIHALDFTSMREANKGSSLGRYVYRKTKKDVVEFKRIKPYEALIDKKVMEFAVDHIQELWSEFDGNYEYLKTYLRISSEILNGGQ